MLIYYEAIYTMEQNLRVRHLQTKQNKKILTPGKQKIIQEGRLQDK